MFLDGFKETIGVEGRYSNNPADPGGATMWGITERVARAHGYTGPMDQLPLSLAQQWYKSDYWDKLNLDAVCALSTTYAPQLANMLFDIGVNMGIGTAAGFVQRALNVLNKGGQYWKDLKVDSTIGLQTMGALNGLKIARGAEGFLVLTRMVNCQRGEKYILIAEQRPASEAFEYGWFLNRIQ